MGLAVQEGVSMALLARRFGVSRKTVYKWLGRYRQEGLAGLADRSRRPRGCAHRTAAAVEEAVLALRHKHPAWGGRKLHHRLRAMGVAAPAPSTITRILRDHGLIDPAASAGRQRRCQRFERDEPNELWQMDFKSPLDLVGGGRCHPLTVIDDHSRYALGLQACANQKRQTVHDQLTRLFERYGLPWALLSDNGSPWCCPTLAGALSRLEVWLMRLDVRVMHGRPYHPQTQGKDERFHRTVEAEVLQGRRFASRASVQRAFDPWRTVYNHQRPHEALGMQTPSQRYRPSPRSMPAVLPTIEYGPSDQVRRVDRSGQFRFHRRKLRAGQALVGESVALRPTTTDGLWKVYYSRFEIGQVDLRQVGPHQFAHVVGRRSSRCAPSTAANHASPL
jgi:transposase InsO family protein